MIHISLKLSEIFMKIPMKKNKQGGKRKGAGRKPIADKKIPIRIFPQQSRVELLKGEEIVKVMCMNYIESEYARMLLAVAARQKSKK